ncbi:MAG: hypothetical protein KAS53_09500 [Candidatus Cloacimonetes bacterium]|nr:hypothetical protein [Candidatus Cloacimonadota bacterium]
MFKKTIILILTVLFLSVSSINYASDPPTFEDLVAYYPEIQFEDLNNYNYTIQEHGIDYYLVKIDGEIYIVEL